MQLVGFAGAALAVLLAGGCILVGSPIIPGGDGDFVGQRFSFRPFSMRDDPTNSLIQATHQAGGTYSLSLVSTMDGQRVEDPLLLSWRIRRFGSRHGDPVYLVQSTEPGLSVFLLALPGDKWGVMALLDPGRPALSRLATAHGVTLTDPPEADGFSLASVTGDPRAVADFLSDALSSDLLQWEDAMGISLMDDSH